MKNPFDPMQCVRDLCAIGERQFKGERAAADYIRRELDARGIAFADEPVATRVPRFVRSRLVADGVEVHSFPTCFVSGTIESNYALISSLTSSQNFLKTPNINFNPRCANAISRSNHYFAPSVGIRREDVDRVIRAESVRADVEVEPVDYEAGQILVGNTKNPKRIFFCHYDSVGPGATDNASGVAVLLAHLTDDPSRLEDALYVFDGNEELSYDEPVYWGHGYRVFEERRGDLLEAAKSILVVDCVGNGPLTVEKNPAVVKLGFPLKNLGRLMGKTAMLCGSFDGLMKVYQSDIDLPNVVSPAYLREAIDALDGLSA